VNAAEIVNAAVTGISAIISLAEKLGQRDAVLAALDATLAAARMRTDVDIAAKHAARTGRSEDDTRPTPSDPSDSRLRNGG
jgi:hypothetical protein